MEKRTIWTVTAVALIALAVPTTSHAMRCCFLRPFCGVRAVYRVGFYQPGARVRAYAVASNCENGACYVSTPAPCEPVGACEPVVSEPEPCAPVVSTPCENGACYLEKTTVPAPCEPVAGCGEYYPAGNGATVAAVDEMIEILNQTRAAYGLAALTNDATLETGAFRQARICAYSGRLTHGAGVAEILAVNAAGLRAAVGQWLASPAHRALLLNGGYRYAGVAVYKDGSGRAWCAVRFR